MKTYDQQQNKQKSLAILQFHLLNIFNYYKQYKQKHNSMKSFHFILAILLLIKLSTSQYQKSWTIQLTQAPTAFRITSNDKSNHQHILVGFQSGQMGVIDAHTKQVMKLIHLFNDAVTQIEVDSENIIIFVVGSINMAQLDHQYNIRKVYTYQQNISQISLSKDEHDIRYVNFLNGNRLISLQYSHQLTLHNNNNEMVTWKYDDSLYIAEISPNHQCIYTVGRQRQKFSIQKLYSYLENSIDSPKYQKKSSLSRQFSFKIERLVIDRRQSFNNDQQLLIVSQQGTIFYSQKGNIITYIPYSIASNEYLISVQYCEDMYISIIHERNISQAYTQYFLTLIRKADLFSHKAIILNELFGQIKGIQKMDCNHNLIVIQSKDKQLYVLQSFKVFSIQQYIKQIFLVLCTILTLLYACYRNSIKNKTNISHQGNKSAQRQSNEHVKTNNFENKISSKGKLKKLKKV